MIANTLADLEALRDLTRKNFKVERVGMDSASDWGLHDGALQHASRGFFAVVGVRSRTEPRAEQVLLYQPQAAITGLLHSVHEGQRHFLIQARAEPGCVDEVQFGPTIQSTPANFMRMHGGAGSPYADEFITYDPRVTITGDTTQSDLGQRYLMKSKRLILAEYHGPMEAKPGFVWASAEAIRDAIACNFFLNNDLRGLLSLSDWSAQPGRAGLEPASASVMRSLSRPVRPDRLGRLHADLGTATAAYDTVALDRLANWRVDGTGLHEVEPTQGFSVEFYKVQAALREVGSWSQPLVNSHGEGYCGLALRHNDEGVEVLVQVAHEAGLASGSGVAPTFLHYPGARRGAVPQGRTLIGTVESDEGGRFFRDVSRYEIFTAPDADLPSGQGFHWLNLAELKLLLRTSNVCTIQMRGLASQLVALRDG